MTPTKNHGSLGDNIKVHFAGAENVDFSYVLHDAGVKYFLFTVLPFIMDQFDIKWGRITNAKHLDPWVEIPKWSNHTIMDSGLFTLMFGACKDIRPDEKFIRRYKDAICRFVNDNKAWNLTCVECDCQKLLGTELAWELRKQMREQLPNNRIINVFHFEDGKDGLDRLIDFSEYIAISVPELRIVKPKTYKQDTYQLARYIKDKKPDIDIHLLGCTERSMLKQCKFCTSSDSTTWQQINRYGGILGYKTREVKDEKVKEGWQHISKLLRELKIEPTDKRIYYYYFWLAGVLLKQEYTKAGVFAWIAIATIFANIFEAKNIMLFGLNLAAGHVMFGSVFLATDILSECYGKDVAKKGVWIGLFADIALIACSQLCRLYTPSLLDTADPSIQRLFSMSLRITSASAVMFFISNWCDVLLFAKLKQLTSSKYLWLRNNVATIVCNCLENFLFYILAFAGVFSMGQIVSMGLATCLLEIVIGVCDTPFLYLARKLKNADEL